MSYQTTVTADSPLDYLRLGESSGTSAADASGNSRNGTYQGTGGGTNYTLGVTGALTGDANTALQVTSDPGAAGCIVSVPAGAWQSFGTGDFAVECWYKGTQTGTKVLVGNAGSNSWWMGISPSGKLTWGGAITGSVTVNNNAWHHLVIERASGTVKLYVDGTLDTSGSSAVAVGNSATVLAVAGLGPAQGGFVPLGTIDEVAVYGAALGATRVTAHYNAGAGSGTPTLAVTETAIDPHTAGIVLHLTGTSTTWTSGGTTFTVSGVAGTSKTAQTVTDNTTATVTVTTGTTAGTLTVSDGTISGTTTVSTYKTVDVTTGGVNLRVLEPAAYTGAAPAALVLYHMGHGEDRTAWTTDTLKAGIRNQLITDGRLLAAVSAGGTSWGNDTALATYTTAHPYILSNWNVGSVVLVGQSMGGLTAFRCAHDPTTYQRVKGVYLIYPCCDALAEYDDNSGFQAEILSAWGAANRAALVTALSGKNPIGLSASGYAGLRYFFHASASDTVVLKAHNTDAMRAVLAGVTTFDNGIVTTSGDHGDATNFDAANASAFVTAALSQSTGGSRTYHLLNGGDL